MLPPCGRLRFGQSAPPGSRGRDPGFAEETERRHGCRALPLPTLPVFPGVAWKGMVGRPWFIIATPRPRLRACVFHASSREGLRPILPRRARPTRPPPRGGAARLPHVRRKETPAEPRRNHGKGINRPSARRVRDRGGGARRGDVEQSAPQRPRCSGRVTPLRRQGRGRRMGAVQHRTVRVGEPHRRHHHARRPRARQARPDAHHQGLVV